MSVNTAERLQIDNSLNHITSTLEKALQKLKFPVPFLMGDMIGACLYFFYHYKTFKTNSSLAIANNLLDRILNHKYSIKSKPTYCSGIAGINWFVQHLAQNGFVDVEDQTFEDTDAILESFVSESLNQGNYDFLHGALGVFYSVLNKKEAQAYYPFLSRTVGCLDQIKTECDGSLYWTLYDGLTSKVEKNKANFGLSHGMPAIIALLAKYHQINPQALTYDLIKGGCSFILTKKNPAGMYNSIYPYSIDLKKPEYVSSRLGWCYGDLGVAISFLHAYNATHEQQYKEEAVQIINHSVSRRDFQSNDIKDAALCHGTAGIAQIFRKFYHVTGNVELKNTSDFWIDQTLELIKPQPGLATGKTKWDTKIGYVENYGLLEGLSGVGLALLSAVSADHQPWDEVLLIS